MREQHLESGFGTGELARNFEKVTASELGKAFVSSEGTKLRRPPLPK